MILIRHKGERLLVESTKGYPGHRVIARDVEAPPHDHCHWKGGKWVEDSDAKAAADERAKLIAMTRHELIEHLVERMAQTANLQGPSGVVEQQRERTPTAERKP